MMSLSRLIRKAPEPRESYPVDAEARAAAFLAECAGGSEEEDRMKDAYEAGYQAGFAACKHDVDREAAGHANAFVSMVDDLVSQRRRLLAEAETAVVELSCQIASRIVGKVAELKQETVVEIAKAALDHLADKQKITIRVNPDDLEILKQHEAEWLASTGGGAVDINPDARIKRGGCLVEGESGSVEAQIDRQIEVLEKALMEAVR